MKTRCDVCFATDVTDALTAGEIAIDTKHGPVVLVETPWKLCQVCVEALEDGQDASVAAMARVFAVDDLELSANDDAAARAVAVHAELRERYRAGAALRPV